MLSGCHGAAEVADLYRKLGFVGVSCAFDRVSLIASPGVGAVLIPEVFADSVKHRVFNARRREPVAILTYGTRRDRTWVFLVGPSWGSRSPRGMVGEMAGHGVRLLDAGQRIWLPMNDNTVGWHWLSHPAKGKSLPLRTTVLSAARDHLARPRVEWAEV